MEPKDVVPCPGNGPYAVLTFAGWTVVGPCRDTVQVNRIDCNCVAIKEPSTVKPSTHHVHFVSSAKEVITPKALNNMMDLEFSERKDTSELAYSQDDNHFLKILRDGIKKENGHYIMPLPFRRDEVFMPNNKEQAISGAMWLKKRLTNDQKMYADYLKFMEYILDKDYAKKVPSTVTAKAGKTCCANFAVQRTADETEAQVGKEIADVLRRNFYVDDCLRSEESDKKAIERVHDTIHPCKEGGFHLTKISSNSRRVLETIPEDERSKEVKGIDLSFDNLPVERTLGVQWHIESDLFGFKITLKDMPLTRRGILSTISSVYDPLGFAAPVLLPAKRISQELCKSDTDWDDTISEEYSHQWERWRIKLPTLEKFTTERCLKPANFGLIINRQVHSFSDASSTGYGQVTYLRQVNSNGEIHCAFLMGKARLAPIKSVTIPRLELTAAVVSSKLGNKIVEELDLNVEKPTYWTDSTTVIRYIVNEQNRYQTYVANRVQTIRDKTDPDQWRFVPGKDNPADDASRGLEIESLNRQHRWISGPDFLWKPENEWPVLTIDMDESIQNDPEVKTSTVHSTIMEEKSTILERFNSFSDWQRLKSVVARILRLNRNQDDIT
ncbi:hypothetical protein QZH41_017705, partial [Actinostola sp. cb2023]